ncbi:class I SAM-dependent methyltransferase [Pseudomonas typographi]|uniref:Class I SAM-dependent methyltransferase n=1 Tax=Pseudomonas typographi TaxID=2715964 RepID=A0ABR7Z196_9PSED|nr:class I SAM-dependent methyltransferase [Pseudomonas typographi]MBD1551734.1 class I SAM-dependent methyltransferase [Pseudomonas typographi]MBD1587011.1 class I SAM-dependent methyltransferase [Pseudomonas typographi]MBD1599250.1 class I SAM-dependent methyltransferase [Pseudomonas typographi]
MTKPVKLPFSEKYDRAHAQRYFHKHQANLSRRLSHYRELQLARKAVALAGDPGLVLDLPCGAGRFWPMLAEKTGRAIIGADNSAGMLDAACTSQPPEVVARVSPLQTSAFGIDLPANAVDSIFCMRLMHHIGDPQNRATILQEFHRVTRDSVILSMWVDGNFKAYKRQRSEARRVAAGKARDYQNRFVIRRDVAEAEFEAAGFRIQNRLDFIPLYAMWRVYVLRKQ